MDQKYGGKVRGQSVRDSFVLTLVGDVISAMGRRDADDTQANRRDLIRTLFAAVEGLTWSFKTEIVEIARSVDVLSNEEEQALSELSFSVTGQGKIATQQRFVPLPALIRMAARLATKINRSFAPRFDGVGWRKFQQAVKVRNRITHPKKESDLDISDADMEESLGALFWLLELHNEALGAATHGFRKYVEDFKHVLARLVGGDPEITSLYNEAQRSLEY
jgi:hypothetical protein